MATLQPPDDYQGDCRHMGSFRGAEGGACECATCGVFFCHWFPRRVLPCEVMVELLARFRREWDEMVRDVRFQRYAKEPVTEARRLDYFARRFQELASWNGWHPEDLARALVAVAFEVRS